MSMWVSWSQPKPNQWNNNWDFGCVIQSKIIFLKHVANIAHIIGMAWGRDWHTDCLEVRWLSINLTNNSPYLPMEKYVWSAMITDNAILRFSYITGQQINKISKQFERLAAKISNLKDWPPRCYQNKRKTVALHITYLLLPLTIFCSYLQKL